MQSDFNSVANVLYDSSKFLKKIAEEPEAVVTKIPEIMNKFQDLKTVVDIEKIKRGVPDMDFHQKELVYKAIDNFLMTEKNAEEKAGAIAGMIFSNPEFITFTKQLKDLSKFLKRGEKVEPTEHEAL